jgi:hypothetical protein
MEKELIEFLYSYKIIIIISIIDNGIGFFGIHDIYQKGVISIASNINR